MGKRRLVIARRHVAVLTTCRRGNLVVLLDSPSIFLMCLHCVAQKHGVTMLLLRSSGSCWTRLLQRVLPHTLQKAGPRCFSRHILEKHHSGFESRRDARKRITHNPKIKHGIAMFYLHCGSCWTRTSDHLLKRQLLYHLS